MTNSYFSTVFTVEVVLLLRNSKADLHVSPSEGWCQLRKRGEVEPEESPGRCSSPWKRAHQNIDSVPALNGLLEITDLQLFRVRLLSHLCDKIIGRARKTSASNGRGRRSLHVRRGRPLSCRVGGCPVDTEPSSFLCCYDSSGVGREGSGEAWTAGFMAAWLPGPGEATGR